MTAKALIESEAQIGWTPRHGLTEKGRQLQPFVKLFDRASIVFGVMGMLVVGVAVAAPKGGAK